MRIAENIWSSIQNNISRMAANSFFLKGWSVKLVAAILGFAAKTPEHPQLVFLAAIASVAFWGLDAYYLALERCFIDLYKKAIQGSVPIFSLASEGVQRTFLRAIMRPSVLLVHLPVLLVVFLAAWGLGAWRAPSTLTAQQNTAPLRTAKVFLSYSHDSEQHIGRVKELVARLIKDGVDVKYDGDASLTELSNAQWMDENIETGDYVLVVCTPGYREKFDATRASAKDSGIGKAGLAAVRPGGGVEFEALLIRNLIYAKVPHPRFIPVLFDTDGFRAVPVVLVSASRYFVEDHHSYQTLLKVLKARGND